MYLRELSKVNSTFQSTKTEKYSARMKRNSRWPSGNIGELLWCLASFNWAQCPLQHKLPTPSLNRGQRTVDIPLKFKVIPEAFALLLWSLSKLHFGSGRESQNSSALVFVQIVLARPQPVFQWTCSFRGQGTLPGRSQFNRSEGDTYQSKVLWLEYTEGNFFYPDYSQFL